MAETFTVDVQIAVTPEDAWRVIGDPCAVPRWYPTYVACELEGDMRRLRRADGGELVERMLTRDEAGMTYSYSVISGAPLRSHWASFTVVPDPKGCRLVWETRAEHEDPTINMRERLAGRQQEALFGLKTLLESGEES